MSLPGDASRFTQLYNVLPVSPELRSPFFLHALYFYFYPRMQTRTQADSPHNDCRGQRSSKTKNLCSKCFAGAPNSETVLSSLSTPTKRSFESASESESDVSPEKRMRVDEVQEEEEPPSLSSSLSASPASSSSSRSGSKHRSRKRCHRCQTKLELVQQELGSCRCGYVFCMLHRLPEQHECLFDHLGRGRQEAVLKMVKLDRKVGRSCQRIGEECS
ncbi:AN1-type zinc finger protein 3 isoform X4 [Gouania willdenowi]|uniref:AN1-type zinc finger protein 3 isoform X4 n=1 Tax=Gouania willdenowi TaxID=441366 RepID=UPI0010548D10|nr:AN1-type zinc finger protein 3-like isoform X4 [Gouania willdenowi]